MSKDITREIEQAVLKITQNAGEAIMSIYNKDFDVALKTDRQTSFTSPLTEADMAANKIIEKQLPGVIDCPIISEENSTRQNSELFWLVDPLDGTKEFVNKNGEFTVNIALIEKGRAVLGVVHAPAWGVSYVGNVAESKSYKLEDGQEKPIKAQASIEEPVVVVSKSHKNQKTIDFLSKLKSKYKEASIGSSLKLCLVAEGKAMLYPRLGPTSLWDTAAADAVVAAAGGRVVDLKGRPLIYYPKDNNALNPYFVVESGNNTLSWQLSTSN